MERTLPVWTLSVAAGVSAMAAAAATALWFRSRKSATSDLHASYCHVHVGPLVADESNEMTGSTKRDPYDAEPRSE